jgi:hypothetical protein
LIDDLKNLKSTIVNQQSNKSFTANGSGIFVVHFPALHSIFFYKKGYLLQPVCRQAGQG